ncbi:SigE family RNA polymerase sigma factor [Hamadaea tsunoensis]|uniref:SigE family RNA polymerase sigma factor n=1 Tax=Hamadaea tsunoensis TaxID=53368 RepID=UPI000415E786|nr:SigE family RNA polymerase sigma factor [Hamadaea tsunoensis]
MTEDDDGFREFVEARYADLLRVAYLLTGSAYEAEDLLQSALVRAIRGWSRVEDPMAYVRKIMVNQHISLWRRLRRRELVTAMPPDRPVEDVAGLVTQSIALHAALRSLPARTRAVVVLRYVVDMSEVDVAGALGFSVGNVKSHASRGLARLRAVLDPSTSARTELERSRS